MNRAVRNNFQSQQPNGLAEWLSNLFASNNGRIRSNASARETGGAHLSPPDRVMNDTIIPNGPGIGGTGGVEPAIALAQAPVDTGYIDAMNGPLTPGLSAFNPLMMQGEGGYSDQRWQQKMNDQKVRRENGYQRGKNFQNDMTNQIDAIVGDDSPRTNEEFMADLAGQVAEQPVAKKRQPANKPAPKRKSKPKAKRKVKAKAPAPIKNEVQAAINNAAGVPSNADRLALLGYDGDQVNY